MTLNAPDAVFPNNWFSTHTAEEGKRGTFVLYPMKAPSRRNERRAEYDAGFVVSVPHFAAV